jgi:hypothetical protein
MAKVIVYNRRAHEQLVPSSTWTIVHNLNIVSPVVDIWIAQNDGTYINSDAWTVDFTDTNTVIVTFDGTIDPPTGVACIT